MSRKEHKLCLKHIVHDHIQERKIQLANAKWNVSFYPAREKFFYVFLHILLCRKEQLSSERQRY